MFFPRRQYVGTAQGFPESRSRGLGVRVKRENGKGVSRKVQRTFWGFPAREKRI